MNASPSSSESAFLWVPTSCVHWKKKERIAHCRQRRHCCWIFYFLVPSVLTSLMTSVSSDPHNLLTHMKKTKNLLLIFYMGLAVNTADIIGFSLFVSSDISLDNSIPESIWKLPSVWSVRSQPHSLPWAFFRPCLSAAVFSGTHLPQLRSQCPHLLPSRIASPPPLWQWGFSGEHTSRLGRASVHGE